MPPARTRLDPEGHYDRLGLDPTATQASIVAAFRAKARLLHPDVPKTGDAKSFVAVKQAYDVLSNRERRAAYDRDARQGGVDLIEPDLVVAHRDAAPIMDTEVRQPRFSDLPAMLWVGAGAFLCLGIYEAVSHLLAPSPTVRSDIRPNAAIVVPLSSTAHEAVLYGPAPVQLAGQPNFYVIPAATPAVLWRLDPEHHGLVPIAQLPPFSTVQAVRLVRQNGMLEVLLNDNGNGNGLIGADHLTAGNAVAARRAYCTYNAGPTPVDGELLQRHGSGNGTLQIENRAVEPAVIKLRDAADAVTLSVFLGPGSHAGFDRLPEGSYHTEFALGELWSRACNAFVAGMRAMRAEATLNVPGDQNLVVAPDANEPAASDIPDQAFGRD